MSEVRAVECPQLQSMRVQHFNSYRWCHLLHVLGTLIPLLLEVDTHIAHHSLLSW